METSTAPSSPKATADTEDEQAERQEQLAETKSLVGGKWFIVKINSGTNIERTMQFIFENGMTVGELKTKIETGGNGAPAAASAVNRKCKRKWRPRQQQAPRCSTVPHSIRAQIAKDVDWCPLAVVVQLLLLEKYQWWTRATPAKKLKHGAVWCKRRKT